MALSFFHLRKRKKVEKPGRTTTGVESRTERKVEGLLLTGRSRFYFWVSGEEKEADGADSYLNCRTSGMARPNENIRRFISALAPFYFYTFKYSYNTEHDRAQNIVTSTVLHKRGQ